MARDTKPNLTNDKFEQFSGESLTLSGKTEIHGIFEIENGGIFTFNDGNQKSGYLLTSDNDGTANWKRNNSITGATNGVTRYSNDVGLGGTLNYVTNVDLNEYKLNFIGEVFENFQNGGLNAQVLAIQVQDDGKILLGGSFTTYSGVTKNHIVRLNTNGTIDTSFNMGTGFAGNYVQAINIQDDGKLIVGGNFTSYNGTNAGNIARLNTDGTIDTTFNSGGSGFDSSVWRSKLQNDGKIIASGNFTSYNGVSNNYIIRLNIDGSEDTTFNSGGSGFSGGAPIHISLQSDDKIIVGGSFTSYNGTSARYFARLNSDGTIDSSFDNGNHFNNYTQGSAVQSDGKIVVVGQFTSYSAVTKNRIVRLNSDGTIDSSFDVGNGFNDIAYTIGIEEDSKILVAGKFTSYNGTTANQITRIDVNGDYDDSLNSGSGLGPSGSYARTILTLDDGKIFMGGSFTSYSGITSNYIVKINRDGTISFDEDFMTIFNNKVIEYKRDYSAYYTNRSLVDKEYVDTEVGNLTGTTSQSVTGATTPLEVVNNNVQFDYTDGNICLYDGALASNSGGTDNIAFGCNTLYSNTGGTKNIAQGNQALFSNTVGSNNIAMGSSALYSNISGNWNIAQGALALCSNTVGNCNIAQGASALCSNINGYDNIAQGNSALYNNTSGCHNIAHGQKALYLNASGINNIAQGQQALYYNTSGCHNIVQGQQALYYNSIGNYNIVQGYAAGFSSTGNTNIYIGYQAGCDETGSNKIYIGCGDASGNTLIYAETDNQIFCVRGTIYADNLEISGSSAGINMSGDTVNGLTTYVDENTICAHSGITYNNSTKQFTVGEFAVNDSPVNSMFIGSLAGLNATGSTYSNFIGNLAGRDACNSSCSNFIGLSAGRDACNSSCSNFIGDWAGYQAKSSSYSNFIGCGAGYFACNSSASNFIGSSAGYQATGSTYSNFIGCGAGYFACNSYYSNFIGRGAGYQATGSSCSNFMGNGAGRDACNSNDSNFIGRGAGYGACNSSVSNFIGTGAGYQATGSCYSNLIGYNVGRCFTNNNIGNNNIIIGTNISVPSGCTDMINLGGILFGTNTYSTTLGDPSIVPVSSGKLGIGMIPTTDKLEISGNTTINGDLTVTGNVSSDGGDNTGLLKRSTTNSITASTTQTQGQQQLTTDINEISIVGTANDVVTLPSAEAGLEILIINNGVNTLQIYPASGDDLGAGVNTSTTLIGGDNVTFVSYNNTNWITK